MVHFLPDFTIYGSVVSWHPNMNIQTLRNLFHTIRHLKPIQIRYQIFYRLRSKWGKYRPPEHKPSSYPIRLQKGIPARKMYSDPGRFLFLNQSHSFETIDWNWSGYGKLWTYNLNYFEYLLQKGMTREKGLRLIHDFITKKETHRDGYEPYPLSLRIINWVKFLGQHQVRTEGIDRQLYSDMIRLSRHLEYHLLANHLIENGFGLLFGACHFRDKKMYRLATDLITRELTEQIMEDGAHYERTPMYHQIILHRVLDSYYLMRTQSWKSDPDFEERLKNVAEKMLAWMVNMTFSTGEMPRVNDTAPGIAPTPDQLIRWAHQIGIEPVDLPLNDSGYRVFRVGPFELLCDAGPVAPDYQPGHSHADHLQFVLHVDGQPVIVDTGISTYEKNERRQTERSTSSHNTVAVGHENSSEVWDGFRVARRAKIKILQDDTSCLEAEHDGYKKQGVTHRRSFHAGQEEIYIFDTLSPEGRGENHLHLHPDCEIEKQGDFSFLIDRSVYLVFENAKTVLLEEYSFAAGFNQLIPGQKIIVSFAREMKTSISFISKESV